jgi:membrane protein
MEPRPRHAPRTAEDAERERSLGALFRDLGDDAARLVRAEIALARAEIRRASTSLAGAAGRIAAGAALSAVGLLTLVAAAVAGLGALLGERYALAAAIIGALFLAAGGLLLASGLRGARRQPIAPTATLETLRETGGWAKDEAASLRAALTGDPGDVDRVDGHRRDGSWGDDDQPHPPTRTAPTATRDPAPSHLRTPAPSHPIPDGPPLSVPIWKRVWREFQDDDIANQAAKVAYYFFLSLPPLMMAAFGLAGIFGDDRTADWLSAQLGSNLPAEAAGLVSGFVDDVVRTEHPGPFSVGLLLALWSGSAVFGALEDTLNLAFDVRRKRGFVRKKLVTLGTLAAVGVLFTAGSAAILAGPAIARALGLGAFGEAVWSVAQWPLALGLVVAAFWVIYYVLPHRDQRRCRLVLLRASAIAAVLWVVATVGFRLYVSQFGSFSQTYGLLGAVIVLLLWMYYTSLVILLGGEIAAEMERGASAK